jgi:hypothetical protein
LILASIWGVTSPSQRRRNEAYRAVKAVTSSSARKMAGMVFRVFDLAGVEVEGAGVVLDLLTELPLGEAAVTPVAEVLFVDGLVVEVFLKDFLGFGQAVEPRKEGVAGFAVFKAVVEFVTDGWTETGDFADADGDAETGGAGNNFVWSGGLV